MFAACTIATMRKRNFGSDGYLTVAEVAAQLGTSIRWIYKLFTKKRLTPIHRPVEGGALRTQVVVDEAEVARYVSDARSPSAKEQVIRKQLKKGRA